MTGNVSKPGEKPLKLVTHMRKKVYFEKRYDEDTDEYHLVSVGRGFEIVKEVSVCQDAFDEWHKSGAKPVIVNEKTAA